MVELDDEPTSEDVQTMREMVIEKFGLNSTTASGKASEFLYIIVISFNIVKFRNETNSLLLALKTCGNAATNNESFDLSSIHLCFGRRY